MLTDHSDDPQMRLLVNETRHAYVAGPQLAAAHRAVGRALAGPIVRHLKLAEVSIEHVAGTSVGVRFEPGTEPIIIAMLRAGLFVSEGIWSALPGSGLVLHSYGGALNGLPAAGRTVVVVDSVINTGRSIRDSLDRIRALSPGKMIVAALVAFRGNLGGILADYPDVDFHIARISDRSYVGKGATDTGGRLFGTTTWGQEK